MTGSMRRPDWVGLAPFTVWKKTGRKVRAPNMAKPTTKPTALAAEKTRLAKRRSGSTGSAARRSTTRNRAVATTPSTTRPIMKAEPQG